jgi:HSP20 family protein
MTMLTVKPENGRVAFPRFSTMFDNIFENEFATPSFIKTPVLVNVKDTQEDFKIEVAVPGFSKDNFSIKVEGNLLTISGEQKKETEQAEEKFTRKEFNFSSFSRSFTLPKVVDATKIGATYEAGILTVSLPKKEEAKVNTTFEVKIS